MAIMSSLTTFLFAALLFLPLSQSPPLPDLYDCNNDNGNYTLASDYTANLDTVLAKLYSNTEIYDGFYNLSYGQYPDQVKASGMCRGDVKPDTCRSCLHNATILLQRICPNQKEAFAWYEYCQLHYSNRSIFGIRKDVPLRAEYRIDIATDANEFNQKLSDLLGRLRNKAASGDARRKYAADNGTHLMFETLYALEQCTPDLTQQDCSDCLGELISVIPTCCHNRLGAGITRPSCRIRFEIYPFFEYYTPQAPSQNNTSTQGQGRRKIGSRVVAILIFIPVTILLMLFSLGCYLLRRKERKSHKSILIENFGDESAIMESLQFDLATIEEATNKFSYDNKIGKGGFGEVYKGILLNGQEIAVKRLSRSSTQGAIEFKNEILLIAKLQHRNLVTLLGFCLEEKEKILIYEYVPNKSLDYFLFDSQNRKLLSWYERYKIIRGIAQAILYLHEYSRLKVIHRDLKPSNVLLDNDMNPKIADFGMAKMVALDQDKGSTMRIVGTYGYMSPEYAMLGQFSEKSDVFSFGVMVLEIISGKRNSSSYENGQVIGLLNYAWRKWKNQTPLDILDQSIKESYFEPEVIRCIEIGLLCVQENPDDRLTMAMVHSYLNNLSIELPFPREPAFYMHGKIEADMVAIDLGQLANNTISSVNEISISNSFPR